MLDCIENNMARLMDGSAAISSRSNAHNPTFPPIVEKVISLIERFIGKYGSVQLEVFRLPHPPLPSFNAISTLLPSRSNVTGSSLLIPGNISPQSQPITFFFSTSIPRTVAFSE